MSNLSLLPRSVRLVDVVFDSGRIRVKFTSNERVLRMAMHAKLLLSFWRSLGTKQTRRRIRPQSFPVLIQHVEDRLLLTGFSYSEQVGDPAIRSDAGFNTSALNRNDDGSTGLVNIGFSSNFFGTTYTQLYVNNNGNVTFDAPLSEFTPFDLTATSKVIIAPFFADVDTRAASSDVVKYGTSNVDGRSAFGVNWIHVGYFSQGTRFNDFQLVMIDRSDVGAGDFDFEMNYRTIVWEAGTASGGNSQGLGGDTARAGYSNGATSSFELAGSAVDGAFLDTGPATTSLIRNNFNSVVDGRYRFEVRNGVVLPAIQVKNGNISIADEAGADSFGAVVQNTLATHTYTVQNTGNAPLIVQPVVVSGPYTVTSNLTANQSIAPGASASFTVQQNTSVIGTLTGTVSIPNNTADGNYTFDLTGVVAATAQPSAIVSLGSQSIPDETGEVSFGSTSIGAPVVRTFTVRNLGAADLIVEPVTVPAGFTVTSNLGDGQVIAPGATAAFSVRMNGTTSGVYSGQLSFSTNDPQTPLYNFSITGIVLSVNQQVLVLNNGVQVPNGTGSVDFGTTPPGTGVDRTLTVVNIGALPLIVQPVTVPAGFSVLSNFTAGQTIAAGGTASFTIRLNANLPGTPSGLVSFASNDPLQNPFTFQVNGIVAGPAISVLQGTTPITNGSGTVSFGNSPVGTAAVSRTITVRNDGTQPLIVQPAVINGAGFSFQSNLTAGQSIAPGASATFVVNMLTNVAGPQNAVLSIPSNDGPRNPFTFNLSGTIIANSAPTDIALSANTIAENQAVGTVVGTLSTTDPDAGGTFTYTLVAGAGSTDNSSFTIDASGAVKSAAVFNFETKNSYSIRVRSTDGGSLFFEKAFTITVTNVNETPTDIALSANTIAENQAVGTVVGTLSTTDPDAGGTFTYTLVAGAGSIDNGSFTIDASGAVKSAAVFNFETKNSYSIRVRSTDGGSLFFEKAFTISVTNVNETPTDIALSASTIAENQAVGTVVGTLSTTDPDVGGTFTYTLVAGAGSTDNASFTIDASGAVKSAAVFNFEAKNSYSILVRSTDGGSLFFEKAFTITVTNVKETPTDIALSANTIAENQAVGTVVGTLSTTDPDAGGTFTYTLVAGAGSTDNSSFTIDASGAVKSAAVFNFETKNSYSIRVRSTDGGSLFFEKAFTISVTDVAEGPTNISLSSNTVSENQPIGTTVGQFSSTDPSSGATFTYSLVAGPGSEDNAAFSIDASGNLKSAIVFNFEVKNSCSIRVRSTNNAGLSFEKSFTISVINAAESPTDIALSANTIPENSPSGTLIGALSTSDPDAGSTFSYLLVSGPGGDDNSSFTIDASGNLRSTAAFNFEAKNSYSIRVSSTDQSNLSFEKSFTISVTNVNESPTDINLSNQSVIEDVPVGTLVGQFTTADPDVGNTFTYALGAGSDNSLFTVDATGQLRTAALLSLLGRTSFTIDVTSTDQGTLSVNRSFVITLLPSNHPPVVTPVTLSVNENAVNGTSVGFVAATDEDAGQTLTYSITNGNSSGAFSIHPTSGQIVVANRSALNYELTQQFVLTVQATDNGSPSKFGTGLVTVNVADVAELVVRDGVTVVPNGTGSISLGVVPQGGAAVQRTLNVRNTGTSPILLQPASITPGSGFSITRNFVAGQSLAPGAAALLTISLDSGASGVKSATVSLMSSDLASSPYSFEVTGTVATSYTIDDGDSGFSLDGFWQSPPNVGYQGDTKAVSTFVPNGGTVRARWSFTSIPDGVYRIDATWLPGTDRTATAPFAILDELGGPVLQTVIVNQKLAPSGAGTALGRPFGVLGQVLIADGTVVVELSNTGVTGVDALIADAIRIVRLGDLPFNNPPQLPPVTLTVPENSGVGTVVGTVTGTDVDAGQTLTYSILSGNESGAFGIDSMSGTITVINPGLLNFETTPSFALTVQVSDDGLPSKSGTGIVTINVTNVNEQPTAIQLSASVIGDDALVGTTVGILSTQDPDSGDTFSYTLGAGGDNTAFSIDAMGNLKTAVPLNASVKDSYTISVTSTDAGGLPVTSVFVITVASVINHAPTVTPATFTVPENSVLGTPVGIVQVSDVDAGQLITLSIIGGNSSGAFAINSVTRQIAVADPSKLNFEVTPTFTLTVQATDNHASPASATGLITINLVDQPEVSVRDGLVVVASGSGTVSLGDVPQNATSTVKVLTVNNNGTTPISLQPATVTAGSGFTILQNVTAGQILNPGGSAILRITMQTAVVGLRTGTVSISSTDAASTPYTFTVTGNVQGSIVIDDGDPGFTLTGAWQNTSGFGFGADVKAAGTGYVPGTGAKKALWTFTGLSDGIYQVDTTWLSGTDRATNAPYLLRNGAGGPTLASVAVNQQIAPTGAPSSGGRPFATLATVTVTGGVLEVELSDLGVAARRAVIADAMRITRVGDL